MQIKLYKTTDGNNVLDKTLTNAKTISNVDIVEPCNVLAPSFILRYDSDALNYNYCSAFGRYYFITSFKVLTSPSPRREWIEINILFLMKSHMIQNILIVAIII